MDQRRVNMVGCNPRWTAGLNAEMVIKVPADLALSIQGWEAGPDLLDRLDAGVGVEGDRHEVVPLHPAHRPYGDELKLRSRVGIIVHRRPDSAM